MPLTEKVQFEVRLHRFNRLQIPKLIRWRYKLEPWQIVKITINNPSVWNSRQQYLGRMTKDGRITIPKLTLTHLLGDRPDQDAYALKVTLEPS